VCEADLPRWSVDFFRDQGKALPVRDWMLGLPEEVRGKLIARIELLREHGPALDFPHTSQIEGRLRELRLRLGKTRYRVLYFFDARRICVLLHGFAKTTQAVPQAEIQIAMRRMKEHESILTRQSTGRQDEQKPRGGRKP